MLKIQGGELVDKLPNFVGYTAPYLVMLIPVAITVSVLTLLFVTSLQ